MNLNTYSIVPGIQQSLPIVNHILFKNINIETRVLSLTSRFN